MLGCAQPQSGLSSSQVSEQQLDAWPDDWTPYIGKRVTIVGLIQEGKGGPTLSSEGSSPGNWLWLDRQQWSDKFCPEPLKGTHARVTATIIKRKDWEVVVDPTGRREFFDRFWLKDATWTYVD
jgi:hypothetical protein